LSGGKNLREWSGGTENGGVVLVSRLTVCDPGGAKASSGIQKIPFSEEKLLEAPHARLVNPAQSLTKCDA
jgi:hypothetical protein